MSRLTIDEVINHCRKTCESIEIVAIAQGKNQDDITSNQYWEHYQVEEWLNELKKYKDAEEQGLLLKLPCKVGDKVFVLTGLEDDNIVHEGKCVGYTKNELRGWLIEVNYFGGYKSFESFTEIGKSVFLTKEEAEQKLKEMESDTNGN